MSESEFTDLQLVGRRVPDYSMEPNPQGGKSQVELPGTFEVGFVLEGVFRPLYTMKAAGLLADIARKKAEELAAPSQDAAPAAPAPAATG